MYMYIYIYIYIYMYSIYIYIYNTKIIGGCCTLIPFIKQLFCIHEHMHQNTAYHHKKKNNDFQTHYLSLGP